ncbi:hypothetical protein MD588_10135 [Photobacterium sp. SDRW27]|uniref:hypothetical protein n=1 Tax=Photobacterium obscurum TaxID=2829490 RepID=UPI002243E0A0|nr:hypothetical protein [Photobacterium obscurum]MCW8329164.1 hypothetical protein [Photobacterium obscurum]
MRHISDFIEQLRIAKLPFSIWVYSDEGQYEKFKNYSVGKFITQLDEAIEKHLEVIIKLDSDSDNAYLLIAESSLAVPINFNNGQYLSMKSL